MRWAIWALALSILSGALAVDVDPSSLPCAGQKGEGQSKCQQPSAPVATVVPGALYIASLPCVDCPISQTHKSVTSSKDSTPKSHSLLFNVTLSQDQRVILLNDQRIFPALVTRPRPSKILVDRVPERYSRADLDNTVACTLKPCTESDGCQCVQGSLARTELDFDYLVRFRESTADGKEQWSITFDALGGRDLGAGFANSSVQRFNSSEQEILDVLVQGREIKGMRAEKDVQAGGSLFGTVEDSQVVYQYEILDVNFAARSYVFATPASLSFVGKLRRFFGTDVLGKDGHFIYLQDEWASYGKKGSFRNYIGIMVHDWPWRTNFIILGCVVATPIALYLSYKLLLVVKEQRKLARWDGMDDVWARLRRPSEEEEDHLLYGGYRDDFDDAPPRYTDEIQTNKPLPNKPLPSKPLPDKPLPSVPLIDT